jgi:hypothetical protein
MSSLGQSFIQKKSLINKKKKVYDLQSQVTWSLALEEKFGWLQIGFFLGVWLACDGSQGQCHIGA